MKKQKLLVFAGTGIEFKNNIYFTKPQFVRYFKELSDSFDVTWVTSEYPTNNFSSPVDGVKIITHKSNRFRTHLILYQISFIKVALQTNKILIFLPGGFMLFPSIFFVKFILNKSYAYIGVDFNNQKLLPNKLLNFIWRKTLIYIMKHCNGVICRGQYLLENVGKINSKGNIISTMPLAVIKKMNASKTDKHSKFKLKKILYLGQVNIGKGILVLLETLKLIDITISLSIVGTGKDLILMKEFVNKNKLNDRVKFYGWVDNNEEIEEIFNKSSFLIQPSIEPEGVPRAIDESIFYNTPVIATLVGGIDKEFTDLEILKIKPNNILDMVGAINVLCYSKIDYFNYFDNIKKRKEIISSCTPAKQHINFMNGEKHV